MAKSQRHLIGFIFIISLIATIGSLYVGYRGDPFINIQTGYRFNRLNAIPPCDLCRYMRIFQYPLVIISGIALRTKDKKAIKYMWPFALIGLIISVYKWGLEAGWVAEGSVCLSGAPCANPTMLGGSISLPLLAVLSFGLICVACFLSLLAKHGKY